jgi:4-hydroxy-3-methylbut-2-enyl diphosphate reductase
VVCRSQPASAADSLEVVVARSTGTCFGVEAAIRIGERVKQPILGPLVHNRLIVEGLSRSGIPILDRYEDVDTLAERGVHEVVITAHGYPRHLKDSLTAQGIRFHDATCPVLLRWVYTKIQRFEESGYAVILVGNPDHAEVIASRSYGRNIHVVYSEADADALPSDLGPTVALCQTTITREKFQRLVDHLRATRYPDLKAVDTRCKPVKDQQEAVDRLAQWVDAMLIVGGFDSSNTTSLARISARYLPRTTYHIDSAGLIDPAWIAGLQHLGIGAGTSTPKSQIEEVKQRIVSLFPGAVTFRRDGDADTVPDDADVSQEI